MRCTASIAWWLQEFEPAMTVIFKRFAEQHRGTLERPAVLMAGATISQSIAEHATKEVHRPLLYDWHALLLVFGFGRTFCRMITKKVRIIGKENWRQEADEP